ncbi:MAG: hypothetical protein IIB38_07365 [Candidatus Hydrogenedentes bacterium]|nr:hypothetical protein [Candidatus Hydrogenedentota bacterium]
MSDDKRFAFQLADPYWNRLLYKNFHYEPEIAAALQLIKHVDYTFLDLGANYGFWSVMVSSAMFGTHHAIAVEPVSRNFDMLSRNWGRSRKTVHRYPLLFLLGNRSTFAGDAGGVDLQTLALEHLNRRGG